MSKNLKKLLICLPSDYKDNQKYSQYVEKYNEICDLFARSGFNSEVKYYNYSIFNNRLSGSCSTRDFSDYKWIRSPGHRLWYIIFKELRSSQVGSLLVEFPDPIESSYSSIRKLSPLSRALASFELLISIFTLAIFRRYIKLYLTYSDGNALLGSLLNLKPKSLLIKNPLIPQYFNYAKACSQKISDTLRLVSVANFEDWHGIDRVIEGMRAFYSSKKSDIVVRLDLIGPIEGSVYQRITHLINKYGLQQNVFIHGRLEPAEYQALLVDSHIAIGSVAMHRAGMRRDSSLKSGLYCAIGIPFIASHLDERFPEDFRYRYMVAKDESEIDIQMIINWYAGIGLNASKEMHEYALYNLTTDQLFNQVVTELEKDLR